MLILGTTLSLRASGYNLFCSPKKRQSMLPKRFALRMLWDFACFLFRLRNAGAYIPKGTPCTLHVSTNLLINVDGDFLSRIHILWKSLQGGFHRWFSTFHTHLHICAHTSNCRGWACKCGRLMNPDSQVDAWCTPGWLCLPIFILTFCSGCLAARYDAALFAARPELHVPGR